VRLTRFRLFLLGGLVLAIVGPVAFTQPGPGGFGKGGFGKGGWDPAEMFKRYSNGKDVINVAEVESTSRRTTTPELREQMTAFLLKKGITNGQMTLALYQEYSDDRRQQFMAKMQQGGWGKFPGGAMPGAPTSAVPGAPATPGTPSAAPASPADLEAQAKEVFARLDTNKDGSLSADEMQAAQRSMGMRLYDEREKYDLDKNNLIDLKEFTAYYKDWMARFGPGGSQALPGQEAPPEEDKRPVVYRAGKLPPELKTAAPWFEQLDKDKDGQVGLYEWKSAGKDVDEFLKMDVNRDGFLTVEEVLRFYKVTTKKDDKSGTNGSSTAGPVAGAGGPGMGTPSGRGSRRGGTPGGPPGGGRGGQRGGRMQRGTWGGAGG